MIGAGVVTGAVSGLVTMVIVLLHVLHSSVTIVVLPGIVDVKVIVVPLVSTVDIIVVSGTVDVTITEVLVRVVNVLFCPGIVAILVGSDGVVVGVITTVVVHG